jgi:CheY-like chemotaxis protein
MAMMPFEQPAAMGCASSPLPPSSRTRQQLRGLLQALEKQVLPRSRRSADADRETSSLPATESGATRLKALVVDDEADVLEVAVELFKAMGYEVFPARSGKEAVDLMNKHSDIDVLLTDVVMPEMDGLTVGREARRLFPQLKIILVSGFPASALASAGPREFDFLLKPYSKSQLAKLLRS